MDEQQKKFKEQQKQFQEQKEKYKKINKDFTKEMQEKNYMLQQKINNMNNHLPDKNQQNNGDNNMFGQNFTDGFMDKYDGYG